MIADQIDIRAEIAMVQEELVLFRDQCLPALIETPLDEIFDGDEFIVVRDIDEVSETTIPVSSVKAVVRLRTRLK